MHEELRTNEKKMDWKNELERANKKERSNQTNKRWNRKKDLYYFSLNFIISEHDIISSDILTAQNECNFMFWGIKKQMKLSVIFFKRLSITRVHVSLTCLSCAREQVQVINPDTATFLC